MPVYILMNAAQHQGIWIWSLCSKQSLQTHAVALDRHQLFVRILEFKEVEFELLLSTDTENMVRKADFRIPNRYLL